MLDGSLPLLWYVRWYNVHRVQYTKEYYKSVHDHLGSKTAMQKDVVEY